MVIPEQYAPDVAVIIGVGLLTHLLSNHWLWQCCDRWHLVAEAGLLCNSSSAQAKGGPQEVGLCCRLQGLGKPDLGMPAGGTRVLPIL